MQKSPFGHGWNPDPTLPPVIVTGASGFLGRHLLAVLKDRYRIYAIGRRSPHQVAAPVHPNIKWYQTDIGDRESIHSTFASILARGGAGATVIHLAAHYDFTGEEHPEYWRTNVDGLRNVLDLCRDLIRPRRFLFASSVAACSFPAPGAAIDEDSLPDGEPIYARTKRIGEAMLAEYAAFFPSNIVRLGALFSDWCEYPVLFAFLSTWLSGAWNARVLGGKGLSAVPYLHVRDAVSFFTLLLERCPSLEPLEVLIASTDGCVSHRQLFEEATRLYFGREVTPVLVPRTLSWAGLYFLDFAGRLLGNRPFERPWMGKYIDDELRVDASRTRRRLGWAPSPRREILRRLPFLLENLKTDPIEWHHRNWAAMKAAHVAPHLRVFQLLEANEERLVELADRLCQVPDAATTFPSYRRLPAEDLTWSSRETIFHLKSAVRTQEKALFKAYCHDIAERRFHLGFSCAEVATLAEGTGKVWLEALLADPRARGMEESLRDNIGMTFRLGVDAIEDTFEELGAAARPAAAAGSRRP